MLRPDAPPLGIHRPAAHADHPEAVLAYARRYGAISAAQQARMVAIRPEAMELEVDGARMEVAFDHTLSDSEDAHRTLVAMLRAL
ncbi:MAG: DUF2470 domain-containing protein [Cyanobium sp.]